MESKIEIKLVFYWRRVALKFTVIHFVYTRLYITCVCCMKLIPEIEVNSDSFVFFNIKHAMPCPLISKQ